MGLWNQLTGKEDADKANKKARIAQEENYAKARREEYQANVTASQLSNALIMSDLSDQMAGKGITDAIRADYEQKIAGAERNIAQINPVLKWGQDILAYHEAGGGLTRTRGESLRFYRGAVASMSANLNSQTQEIDRIEGILGIAN